MSKNSEKNVTGVDRRTVLKTAAAATAMAAGSTTLPGLALSQTPAPKKGGTLRVAMPYNPAALDPMTGRNLPDFNALFGIFDGLFNLDAKLTPGPGLAKAFHFDNPTTLVLDLVEGVEFHDGTPFNADAVKVNLLRYRDDKRSNIRQDVNSIASVEPNGKNQVVLKLTKPNASIITLLGDRAALMISPKSIEAAAGGNVDRTPVGTGAFRFKSWEDNDRIIMVKNPNYWRNGLPYLDAVNMQIIAEVPTGLRSVQNNENDLAMNSSITLKALADKNPDLVSMVNPGLVFQGFYMNYTMKPFDDKRVRQAMQYALDRDALNTATAAGAGEPSNAVLPKAHWACDQAHTIAYPHDVAKAKALLAEAGYKDGIDIPLVGWSDQISMQRQELAMAQLAEAGIRIKLTPASPQDSSTMFFTEHKYPGRFASIGAWPDPSQQYDTFFGKDSFYNAGKVELPGYRELLDATTASYDQEARKAAFAKLQAWEIDQALITNFYFSVNVAYLNKRVKNVFLDLLAKPKFHETWLDV